MYVDNILWFTMPALNSFWNVLPYFMFFVVLFSVYVVPYFSEIGGENNIWDEIKLDA